ncbi:MAG: hypothetical protein ACREDR_22025 [Blastocatellia bacterium]
MNNGSKNPRVPRPPAHSIANAASPNMNGVSPSAETTDLGTARRAGQPSVEMHIGELSLVGFKAGDKHIVGDALERELTRLLAGNDGGALPNREIELDRLDLGSFQVRPGMSPRAIGVEVAAAIFRRLTR